MVSESYRVADYLQHELREKMNLWVKWIFYGSLLRDRSIMTTAVGKARDAAEQVLLCKQKLSVMLVGKDNRYAREVEAAVQRGRAPSANSPSIQTSS